MTKREVKALAVRLSMLRPRPNVACEAELDALWSNMVHEVSEHIPSNLAEAFGAACTNGGVWMRDYER